MISKHNVDQQEIAKFEAIAPNWWDLEGEFKPLHQINPLRVDFINQHTDGLFGKTVLDVGCGGGILTESMAREGANTTGIDMGKEPLEIAKIHAISESLTIDYQQCTVEEHAKRYPSYYDVVTCMEMLEHVPSPESVVKACTQLVKPGGQLFFSTISRNLKAWLLAIVAAEYLLHLVPKGTHDIKRFIRPSELIAWLEGTPLQAKQLIGLHYNPLSGNFRLGHNVDVNYILCAQHVK